MGHTKILIGRGIVFLFIVAISIFPTGAQERRILVDTVHDNNQYATFQLLKLFGEGEVETPPFFPLNGPMLKNYDVFIIASPHLNYFPQEISSICSFVKEGGTLLILSDRSYSYNLASILDCFDVIINRDTVEGFEKIKNRGYFSVEDLHFDNPSSLEIHGKWDFVISVDEKGFSRGLNEKKEYRSDFLNPPGSMPVIAAGRKVGRGAIVIIGEIPNFAYTGNQELFKEISTWIPSRNHGEELETYKKIFDFQKSIEVIYYKKIPLQASIFLESAWISYYKNEYGEAERNITFAEQSLKEERISLLWICVPALLFLLCGGILKYLKTKNMKEKMVLTVGIIALSVTSVFVGFYYNFFSLVLKIFLLLLIFVFGALNRQNRLYFQIGTFCILLSFFYFSCFPASSTLGPYYSPEKLIIPKSVPVTLMASDISLLDREGAIKDEISFVEDVVNSRIKYRTEDQNFFPTPVATTRHGEGNCFRQALLASSLLIQLGYKAQVVSGIDHAWVEVQERGILYPKPPAYLRFDNKGISVEYFPGGAFLLLIFLSLLLAYWPSKDFQSVKDILLCGGLSLLFMEIVTESSYIPYHLFLITFPFYFLLLRFASKRRHIKLTSKQQFLLKFAIIVVCFFVFVIFPIFGTMGRIFTYYYIFFPLFLLFTIFLAIYAELFAGESGLMQFLEEGLKGIFKLRKES